MPSPPGRPARCLADVAGDCDDLAVVVVFLQPGNDDGGVQTAGVRQNYLFDVFLILFHDDAPLSVSLPRRAGYVACRLS